MQCLSATFQKESWIIGEPNDPSSGDTLELTMPHTS